MRYLFAKAGVFDVLHHQTSALNHEIDELSEATIENALEEELVGDLAAKYKLQVPVLEDENASTSYREVQVDVSRDPMRTIIDRSRPFYIKGTEITITIPFKGDSQMFQITPSTFTTNPPQGQVEGREILLKYTRTDNNAAAVKAEYESNLAQIKNNLAWLAQSVAEFNGKVGQQVRTRIAERKRKLAGDARMAADIGLPIRQKSPATKANSRVATKVVTKGIISPKKWDLFICHATEDKDALVRPLANALQNRGISVWYDEFSLKVGDSLRASIDYGLANSRYGVVILSKRFFAKHWPVQELNGLAGRETGGKKVILPVWHEVSADDVGGFSPILADRLAAKSDIGVDRLLEQIIEALEQD